MRCSFNVNPLSANSTKWSSTLKKFVGKLLMNCLSVFDHFVKLALKGLIWNLISHPDIFEKKFERHYHYWKLKVGGSISLICDWKWLPGLVCLFTPFLCNTQSIYIAALPFLINWNEKHYTKSSILTMDHKLFVENSSSAAVNTLPNCIIYFECRKVFGYQTETDLLHETNLELKIKVWKIDNGMLYYGCKDLGLLCRKLKRLWLWLFLFS